MESTIKFAKCLQKFKLFSKLSFNRINFSHKNTVLCKHYSDSSSTPTSLARKTCLYEYHVAKGGKMVNFAGFEMPVQYSDLSIIESHLHTRQYSSVFDVSHMLQMLVKGKDKIEFMQSITVADIEALNDDSSTLTLYTNDSGGIIDDLIVTRTSNHYLYVVSNAGRIDEDLTHVYNKCNSFKSNGKDVSIEILEDNALIAVQGPTSQQSIQPLVNYDLSQLYFMNSVITTICGINGCRITRCGYTGEDGFEISVAANECIKLVDSILTLSDSVKLAGLGARDSLRLEAGLCLYGNDIDETTTPIEANLTWTIGKTRRGRADFPGAQNILRQLKEKPLKRRVGILALSAGPPARAHTPVLDIKSKQLMGSVTSGCPSPSLKKNIAMCYLPLTHCKIGTKVLCDIRGKQIEYEVVKLPFVQTNYYTK